MRQTSFKFKKAQLTFGGAGLKSSPKTARPIDTKSATHLTLKCSRSLLRLPKTIRIVNHEIERACEKYGFTLYKYSNNFNHLHLVLRITHRYRWRQFIRELTGRLAWIVKVITGFEETFWLGRPFSRIIKGWGRNFNRVTDYVELNIVEAIEGLTRAQAREFQRLRQEFG